MITLAPTVTLWDAGEFITAAKVLGVPHPPGTPLFVLLGHVWAGVVRIGGYAWRLNLMSACFSASGAGCLFLVAHRLLQGEAEWLRIGGAAAAAILAAFPFTHWQNSNETEVYAVATFSIAAICWLGVRWRDLRGTARAPHILLLIVYIAALSIGNHLLALLVGPALSLFMLYTLRALPAADPAERQMEWAEWGALTAVWIVLVAVGLGSTPLIIAGGALLAACVVWSVMVGSWAFPVMAIGIAVVGISIYAFLYIRSGLHPILNEADPETWRNLLAVIRREQFGSRGLLDNPMVPGSPRTLTVFGQQFLNYFQYCSWQWGRALPFVPMVIVALVFVTLGSLGFEFTRRRDAGLAYLLGGLWLVTSVGLRSISTRYASATTSSWSAFRSGACSAPSVSCAWFGGCPNVPQPRLHAGESSSRLSFRCCRWAPTSRLPPAAMVPTPPSRATSPTTCCNRSSRTV
ncbi:MAG: hypothetical protein AUH41_09990 [Gemmatimonadetes bacterium 13_1_40CM_66_11]|nr:MAG: hypothetical protein AUH41_09990 [Gemmatimonadetes bacterium 13_1_40CM_66_11]